MFCLKIGFWRLELFIAGISILEFNIPIKSVQPSGSDSNWIQFLWLHIWFLSFAWSESEGGEFTAEVGGFSGQGWVTLSWKLGQWSQCLTSLWFPFHGPLLYPHRKSISFKCGFFFNIYTYFIVSLRMLCCCKIYVLCDLCDISDIQRVFQSGPFHPQPRVSLSSMQFPVLEFLNVRSSFLNEFHFSLPREERNYEV